MIEMPGCIRCGGLLADSMPRGAEWPVPAPAGGTTFTSRGNYGSTLWDPQVTSDPRYLMAVICDPCLIVARETGRVLIVAPPPVTRPPQVRVWREEEQ